MTVPYPIANDQRPDGVKLQANFDYIEAAAVGGVRVGTYDVLKGYAVATPSTPFIGWATDILQVVLYTSDITVGDAGFVTLGGA